MKRFACTRTTIGRRTTIALLAISIALASVADLGVAGASADEVNAASANVVTAITKYLALEQPGSSPTAEDWEAFYDLTDRRIKNLKKRFKTWSRLLNDAVDDGSEVPENLLAYRDALRQWIADQAEQATLSRDCFETSGEFSDQVAAQACFAEMIEANGTRWQANADEASRLGLNGVE